MPFTFSHPAAVLPFLFLPKRWFSLTGLVLGSLAPDFEYFIRMKVQSSISHTWTGLLWFNLPLSIFLATIFHLCVRDKFIDSLPHSLQGRLMVFKEFNWTKYLEKNFIVVSISCMIGAMTHILWDGFTHQHGYFVQTISNLRQSFFVSGHSIPVYKILQHLSSLVGGFIIIYTLCKLPKHLVENKGVNWGYWTVVSSITLVVLTARVLLGNSEALGTMIVSMITGGMLGLILTPAVLSWSYKGR